MNSQWDNSQEQVHPKQQHSASDKLINIELLQEKINELNSKVGNENCVIDEGGIKRFSQKAEVSIVVYKNGIIVDDSPFRPFDWDITKSFLMDIIEGFFPYEFKEKYPEGVRMKTVDKTGENYTRLMATTTEVSKGNIKDLETLKNRGEIHQQMSKHTYLNKLPQHVIRNGKIVPVRSEVNKILNVCASHFFATYFC